MAKIGYGRLRMFKRGGGVLYIPKGVVEDPAYPFRGADIVKCDIADGKLAVSIPEWWELLNWERIQEAAYKNLKPEIQDKIKQARSKAPTHFGRIREFEHGGAELYLPRPLFGV